MRPTVDTNGIVRTERGAQWAAAGVAGRGAEVRWFAALALPVALVPDVTPEASRR